MIFVTGATGLVGRAFLDACQTHGLDVTALIRDERSRPIVTDRGAAAVLGVVEDPELWGRVDNVQAIVHAAALVAPRVSWERFHEVNVQGARLAAQRALDLDVPLVHISSVAVYGRRASDEPAGSITENHPQGRLRAHDYYARSKREAELAVTAFRPLGLEVCVLRPCVVYGPGDRLLLPKLVAQARRGWFPLVGPGTAPLSLVHSRSVAEAALAAIESGAGWGRAFNITGDDRICAREVVETLAAAIGQSIRTFSIPARLALALAGPLEGLVRLAGPHKYPGSVRGAVRFWRGGDPYDHHAATATLGWAPTVRHREALLDAARTYL